jgi:hypothetical protein
MIATNKGVKMETAYRIMYDDLELFQRISYGFLEKDNVVRLFPTWRMAFEWLNLVHPEFHYRDITEMILEFEGISFNGFEVEGE